ncbi:ImmA/IrrE family metallo-endopeptidase [Aliivibrio logei]|uniref:IrrE N-terminal-like domain-containing protein n=1 Tax=Aliivibrio logei 5S-186 TaxID=626086 RepID=A0ABX3ARQ7_ALILO|nr:ImmA/IrrE family metallo-endopeptidase [Aliivibrio logei]OEF10832.1 hypothetical protein A1Q5_01505 [Aliivibrio logei 5S-186]
MSVQKFDDSIINSEAKESAKSLYDSYCLTQEQLANLPAKFKKDFETVRFNMFKEIHHQKTSNPLFRKLNNTNDALVIYWLSSIKKIASLFISLNDIPKFNGITKEELKEIANLNYNVDSLKELERILALKGIIFVIEPSLPSLKTDGAVYKLSSGNPVIALSLRHKRLDNFWFTLMHELSHIFLHYDKFDSYIIDDIEDIETHKTELIELEANKLANDLLIPRNIWRTCLARRDLKSESIIAFSKIHNIHPSIIAGRICLDNKECYKKFSKILNEIDTREILIHE